MNPTLVPAYGRDYKSKEAVLKDWKDGKDFQIALGPYCSIRDFPNGGVSIRYAKLTKVVVIPKS